MDCKKGSIYFVQPKELIGTNRYKIGCSAENNLLRFKQGGYNRGTRYIIVLECNEPFKLETKIKNSFNIRFDKISGYEYFEGNEDEMQKLFYELFFLHENSFKKNTQMKLSIREFVSKNLKKEETDLISFTEEEIIFFKLEETELQDVQELQEVQEVQEEDHEEEDQEENIYPESSKLEEDDICFKEIINTKLKDNRPNLSPSSVNTYTCLIVNILKKLKLEMILDSFHKYKSTILKHIQTDIQSNQTKKTILSAVFIVSKDKEYQNIMLEICKKVNDINRQRQIPEHPPNLTFVQVQDQFHKLKEMMIENSSLENIQNVIIIGLMSGIINGIPPLRNEWTLVKIKNFNENCDSFFKDGVFTFNNKQKNNDLFIKQSFKLPEEEFYSILLNWLKLNKSKSDYLLYKIKSGKPLSSSDLSKKLKQIFNNSSIGCDQLRLIYHCRNK